MIGQETTVRGTYCSTLGFHEEKLWGGMSVNLLLSAEYARRKRTELTYIKATSSKSQNMNLMFN